MLNLYNYVGVNEMRADGTRTKWSIFILKNNHHDVITNMPLLLNLSGEDNKHMVKTVYVKKFLKNHKLYMHNYI